MKYCRYFSELVLWSALWVALLGEAACESRERPLDAKTRRRIDSLIVLETRQATREIDSLCNVRRQRDLSRLADSIRQAREARIRSRIQDLR